MAQVKLEKVIKRYDDNLVVKGIDLEINDKEFVVLVGPSGCGKSTTLRMVAGLESISDGQISIDGQVVNNLAPKDRDIAMVFQSYALYPHMNVRQNLEFGLKMRRTPAATIKKRVDEAVSMLGLDDLLDRQPKQLSGGQRQRVAMGRAIVRRPKVFLFDEPLSNLDAKLRTQMRVELARLHRKLDATMIYVTHDQVEAMTLADRIVVMNDGIIQQVGKPLELYQRPANRFVAGFIGTPAMNFIDGKLSQMDDTVFFNASGIKAKLNSYRRFGSKDVTLGIRPTDIELSSDEPHEGALRATVDVSEPMGSEVYLYLDTPCGPLVATTSAEQSFDIGDILYLDLQSNLHLFERQSQNRIQA